MRHHANPRFWKCFEALPAQIQERARADFGLLKQNPRHPSLHLKKVGQFWSVRTGSAYRALAVEEADDLVWFWIGQHDDYERIIGER